jgi:hypothetical protein
MPHRIFLLSPAYAGGQRARMIMSERATFALAQRLRHEGATLAEVFTFLSGLYFRGKIAYARVFGCAADGSCTSFVITPTRGLIDAETRITLDDLREFAEIDIKSADPRYRKPLERDARRLARSLPRDAEIVLLGSIASGKYVDALLHHFGERLRFVVAYSCAARPTARNLNTSRWLVRFEMVSVRPSLPRAVTRSHVLSNKTAASAHGSKVG